MVLSSDGLRCERYAHLPEPPKRTWGEPIDLVEPVWSLQAVAIDPAVVRWFVGRHRVDEETARRELSGLLRYAAEDGTRRKAADGSHLLSHQGFTVVLSPDGAVITGYETVHFERTPSQVRDRMPSRFGRARQRDGEPVASPSARRDQALLNPPKNTRVSIEEIPKVFDSKYAWVTSAVVDHDLPNRDVMVDGLRVALRSAARGGRWVAGTAGRFNLHHRGRRWIISADGQGVLSCKPPWPLGAQSNTATDRKTHGQPTPRRKQRQGRLCDLCGRPSGGPICQDCDRKLRSIPRQAPSGPDRLYSVRSVVYGGLPSLGKRR
jgi:hypothetical protein